MLISSHSCRKEAEAYDRRGHVVGVGGGSVIDQAKIIATAMGLPCIAVPTTAAGAGSTSHAVVWGRKKYNVSTVKPKKIIMPNFPIRLSPEALEATMWDCWCHILESRWSEKATKESKFYCLYAEAALNKFFRTKDIRDLISAGNLAGHAIEVTGTNIIHQLSYPITLKEGFPHGLALKEVILRAVK